MAKPFREFSSFEKKCFIHFLGCLMTVSVNLVIHYIYWFVFSRSSNSLFSPFCCSAEKKSILSTGSVVRLVNDDWYLLCRVKKRSLYCWNMHKRKLEIVKRTFRFSLHILTPKKIIFSTVKNAHEMFCIQNVGPKVVWIYQIHSKFNHI